MPRRPDPEVRSRLISRAAEMLAAREPVTLRSLVQGTGVSTMAVYTYFDGMPGLWRAVRQEGFTRLAAFVAEVPETRDPVHDLAALGAAYQANALADPARYRAMFDAAADLEDPAAADAPFQVLVAAATRARDAGRFAADVDPSGVALRYWAFGHGLAMLVVGGVLDPATVRAQAEHGSIELFVGAGDDPARCRRSVRRAWAHHAP